MKKKRVSSKLILFLAIGSFVVAMLEGILYYANENIFFNALMILQNGINAFMFKPSISLTNAMDLIKQNGDLLHTVVGYMYGVAVFTAPYCTVAAVYRVLENLLRVIFSFRKKKKWQHIIIFGYNNDVKAMIDNYSPEQDQQKRCVHVITTKTMSTDMKFDLGKKGYLVHCFDLLNSDEKSISRFLTRSQVDIADRLILFEESSVTNFSLLQIFSSRDGDGLYQLKDGAKIICRCDDDAIAEMISDHYNACGGEQCRYELDIVSIPELQIRKMFDLTPLHEFYKDSQLPPDKWHTKMLIMGFGKLGRQALIQAIEQSAVTAGNKVEIDVFDTSIQRKAELFANRLSSETFRAEGNKIKLSSSAADGELTVTCYDTDVTYKNFYELIKRENEKSPYTYVLISINEISLAVGCALRLSRLFAESGQTVPMVLRMDTDRRLAKYINENNNTLTDVQLLEDRSTVLTLDYILAEKLDLDAKQFHYFYSTIQVLPKDGQPWPAGTADIDLLWKKNSMFKRRSSKAVASHAGTKAMVFERLARLYDNMSAAGKIDSLIGKNGSLMRYTDGIWRLNADEDGFLEALQKDRFALACAKLEHRRWCYFVAADGWRYGKKRNDALKIHDCLMDFDDLLKDPHGRGTIMYDLMPLMAQYLESSK